MDTQIVKIPSGNFRVLRGAVIVAHVSRSQGGWRVISNTTARKSSRKVWDTPKAAFNAYYRGVDWAKPMFQFDWGVA